MLPQCPKCNHRYMRRIINPNGYWCPNCDKIVKEIYEKELFGD